MEGKSRRVPLGELLVQKGVLDSAQLQDALQLQSRLVDQGLDKLLGDILVARGFVTPEHIRDVLQEQQKRVVVCGACRSEFNAFDGEEPGSPVTCPHCGRRVRIPLDPGRSSVALPLEPAPQDPGPTPVAYLVVKNFEREDEVHPLRRGDRLLVGRGEQCDVVLPGEGVDDAHCQIMERAGELLLVDSDSLGGTFVNGTQVRRCKLHFGDLVLVGRTPLMVNQGLPATPFFRPSPGQGADERACFLGLDPTELSGTSLGGFRLLRQLGVGGMSVVYLAEQVSLGRLVALKVLKKDFGGHQKTIERFMREARAGARLNHPNIVMIYDAAVQGGLGYIAMEYVEGEDVGRWIKRFGKLPVDLAVSICVQTATALDVAHAAGIVHRDVKPTNILFSRGGVAKLLDLGIAKILEEAFLEESRAGLGTLSYMPPEQTTDASVADHRADVYSLGASLYKMVTGQAPFRARTVPDLVKMIRRAPLPDPRAVNPAISQTLVDVLERAMAKSPEDRYPDMKVMRDALVTVIG
ncbi:MAG: protein kinase [Deltaproteobacteria bacterium]|nr:protein kinase [Deltaproteobacteria bacterium]